MDERVNPIKGNGMGTEHAAAAVVIGALVALIAIKRGFTLPVNVSVK